MLRITVNKSASGAKKYYSETYYSEGKSTQKYYSEKDQSMGLWGGQAAMKLGLKNEIDKNDFASLCDNINPDTKEQLTERNNAERRVGYDFTFNASKSVSLAYTFGNENEKKELLQAFRDSVKEAMGEVEKSVQTRVRKSGLNENRDTENIVYGEFVHFTGRPVDGIPDPHLHAHCFVFNATYDNVEDKWKAGEFGQVKKDAPYYEAVFHSALADRLVTLGYTIEKTNNGFDIKGIDRTLIDKFSRRTEEIDNFAAANNITDKSQKSELGAKTRESKRNTITKEQQNINWIGRLTSDEIVTLNNLKKLPLADEKKKENFLGASQAIDFSLNHHLERKSVTTDKEILTTAIRSSLGQQSYIDINHALNQNTEVIKVKEDNQIFITTKDALHEENNLITKAYATKGNFKPINENYQPSIENLTDEQKTAINHALSSTDGITIIAGKAGTGKTTLMKEVQQGIKSAGKDLYAFAPSAEASRMVQRKEGFENAETVATLIQNKNFQDKLKNAVIWIDEAGMLSNRDMNKILKISEEQNARIILTGDIKQHNSVERGDALRILQTEAGIAPAQVNKIQRQKNEQYKQAVDFLGKSDVEKGFKKLEKNGSIHEIEDSTERVQKIAEDYYSSTYKNKSKAKKECEVLVVSPTHAEGDKVTEAIRNKLKKENILSPDEHVFMIFKNSQLTAAEKEKKENYTSDRWIIFHQNCKGFKAGAKYQIAQSANNANIKVKDANGRLSSLPMDKSSCYNVFDSKNISIATGDKVRITGNGKAKDGKHIFNGNLYKVEGFDKQGNLMLSNGSTISKDYGHFNLGYAVTSHASQGKTVDKVIISQSSMSFRASSKEQFYVSVSRGRQAVSIYTDDKAELLHAVQQSHERRSAIELTKQKIILNKVVEINRNNLFQRGKEKAYTAIGKLRDSFTSKNMSHELSR
ncbi:hypothetical protein BH10BAC2_BH10BAC2_27070 [soil metagenome]